MIIQNLLEKFSTLHSPDVQNQQDYQPDVPEKYKMQNTKYNTIIYKVFLKKQQFHLFLS